MNVIAQAIADRQSEIDRLLTEIKALTHVEELLGASTAAESPASRRSSPRKAPAAATAESQPEVKPQRTRRATKATAAAENRPEAKPQRKRRSRTAAEKKKAVSERMTAYWAAQRSKSTKK